MKTAHLIIFVMFIGGVCFPTTAKAGPDSPTITWADLDGYIDMLPAYNRTDPVCSLRTRLRELKRQKSRSRESKGLQAAIGLIGLARSIRIMPADDTFPLLAGL